MIDWNDCGNQTIDYILLTHRLFRIINFIDTQAETPHNLHIHIQYIHILCTIYTFTHYTDIRTYEIDKISYRKLSTGNRYRLSRIIAIYIMESVSFVSIESLKLLVV